MKRFGHEVVIQLFLLPNPVRVSSPHDSGFFGRSTRVVITTSPVASFHERYLHDEMKS